MQSHRTAKWISTVVRPENEQSGDSVQQRSQGSAVTGEGSVSGQSGKKKLSGWFGLILGFGAAAVGCPGYAEV